LAAKLHGVGKGPGHGIGGCVVVKTMSRLSPPATGIRSRGEKLKKGNVQRTIAFTVNCVVKLNRRLRRFTRQARADATGCRCRSRLLLLLQPLSISGASSRIATSS